MKKRIYFETTTEGKFLIGPEDKLLEYIKDHIGLFADDDAEDCMEICCKEMTDEEVAAIPHIHEEPAE